MNEESRLPKQKKRKSILWVFIVAFIILTMIVYNIVVYFNINSSMNWDKITKQDNEYYAELTMIPEIADNIDIVYIRGIRDPAYCIETVSFNTLSELYEILPYKDDQERKNALETLGEVSGTFPDIPSIDQVSKVYVADKIPVTEEDKDGKVLSYYYDHENYVIQTGSGFRLVFIVQTN